jgi:hypothetical protein
LAKASLERSPTCAFGNQYAGRPHERVHHIARTQRKLLDPPIDPGADDGLVKLDLRLRQLGLRAGS